MNNTTETGLSSYQIVCFDIGTERYGLDILQVQEFYKLSKITRLPQSQDFIMGVIDFRGRVMPIVDLSKKFGIRGSNVSENSRAIVIDIDGKFVGLAIDSVSHVVKVDSKDIEPPPPVVKGISGRYIVGIAKIDEGFVVILDINQIFSSNELSKMASGQDNKEPR